MAGPLGQDADLSIPMWKSYLYQLQQQAPKPRRVVCHKEIHNRPSFYGKEYHGAISREEADQLLGKEGDGSYLIRESQRAPGQYTLAIRFENVTKNFKLYYDGMHYVGEKRFDTMQDLIADGLITFYMEAKAADYIAALSSQSNYEESPYMTYKEHRRKQLQTEALQKRQRMQQQQPLPPTPPQLQQPQKPQPRKNRSSRSSQDAGRSKPSVPTEGSRISQIGGRPTPATPVEEQTDKQPTFHTFGKAVSPVEAPPEIVFTETDGSQSPTGQGQDSVKVNHATNTDGAMLETREPELPSSPPPSVQVLDYEKPHVFKGTTFRGPHWCDYCANFLWGLIAQGVKCQDCGFNAHKKCSEKVPNDCLPDMKHIKRMFGVDLTTLVKAQNSLIPQVVELCIKELEKRGLSAEGLYRVAGFHDDVEAIKMAFDKDIETIDISTNRYDDINTISSVLKLFLRTLPIPLITFDVYPEVMVTVKSEYASEEERIDQLRRAMVHLPPAHYHTLKYLMTHLNRVTTHKQQNMMNPDNLAIVFAPTLLRSPIANPLESLTAVKYERELIEYMIINQKTLFDH